MSARRFTGSPPGRQRGVALLVAILIVALGTVLAAAVAYENAMTARRGTATYAFDQAMLIHQGAEAIAAFGLRQIVQQDAKQLYIGQGWDKPYGPLEVVPGVMLEASLEDLQGRFNLNSLVNSNGQPDAVQVAAFTKLLELVGVEPKWVGYVVDWIDYDGNPTNPDGAEDSVYMGQDPPYRSANRYITSASELLALPGFGRDRYMKLAPYISALPPTTTINLCTASGVVLDAYLPEGKREFSNDPDSLAKTRQNTTGCFPTVDVYQVQFDAKQWSGATATPGTGTAGGTPLGQQNALQPGTQGGLRSKFAQTSHYFQLKSFITIGSTEFNLYSLLYQDGTQMVRPIQRSFTPD
jgi:general secretion pathway protein K